MRYRRRVGYLWNVILTDDKMQFGGDTFTFSSKEDGDYFLKSVRTIDPAVADSAKCRPEVVVYYMHPPRGGTPTGAFVQWQCDRAKKAGLPPEEIKKIEDGPLGEEIVIDNGDGLRIHFQKGDNVQDCRTSMHNGTRFGFPVD